MEITEGTKVFVTGAASGIGRSTTFALATMGCRLFLTDRNEKGLQETAEMVSESGGEVCLVRALDVSNYEDVKAFAEEIHGDFGPVDIVMNVAGIALFALLEDMTYSHWKKIIDVNLLGPIHTIQCFVPEMIRAKKGHVVNVSSLAGLIGLPWHAAYCASKAGLVRMSEVMRTDLKQHHVGVTVVCPGGVDTPIKHTVEILGVELSPGRVSELKERFAHHAITPERVASQIINAVRKNKYMVITSPRARFFYFCKHHFPPLFYYVLDHISDFMNSIRYPGGSKV